jgi:hypothetical protein
VGGGREEEVAAELRDNGAVGQGDHFGGDLFDTGSWRMVRAMI